MIKKIVLAYSGGLDTSVILKWLQNTYKAEIITYTSNLGQEIDTREIIQNAKSLGCLLYTSDAADDLLCVDLGGRRIIKKK